MSGHSDLDAPREPGVAPGAVAGGVEAAEQAVLAWIAQNLARAPEPSAQTRAIIAGVLAPGQAAPALGALPG